MKKRKKKIESEEDKREKSKVENLKEMYEGLRAWNQNKMDQAMQQKGVKWTFNLPDAAHHGGMWERMISTVKRILLSVIKQQTLDDATHTLSHVRWKQISIGVCWRPDQMIQIYIEYLLLMQDHQKWKYNRRHFVQRDIVLKADASSPQGSWVTARVTDTHLDWRGMVRSVMLQLHWETNEQDLSAGSSQSV